MPGETLSLTPAGGGEGDFPEGLRPRRPEARVDDRSRRRETRHYWVVFRGYRYRGQRRAARRSPCSLPDARGRRVQLVIADPARGDCAGRSSRPRTRRRVRRAEHVAVRARVHRHGDRRADLAGLARGTDPVRPRADLGHACSSSKGRALSETSAFTSTGGPRTSPGRSSTWGDWQDPRQFGSTRGGDAAAPHRSPDAAPRCHGARRRTLRRRLAAEGGVELDVGAHAPPAASPFPISYSRALLPRWTIPPRLHALVRRAATTSTSTAAATRRRSGCLVTTRLSRASVRGARPDRRRAAPRRTRPRSARAARPGTAGRPATRRAARCRPASPACGRTAPPRGAPPASPPAAAAPRGFTVQLRRRASGIASMCS